MLSAVDLLYETPMQRVSTRLLERALVFAFAAGDTDGAFEAALSNAKFDAGSYDPRSFASDLFLQSFVQQVRRPTIGQRQYELNQGYLLNALSHPPQALSSVHFRVSIFQELIDSSALRQEFEACFQALHALRTLLSRGDFSARMNQVQRRLEILQHLRALFTCFESSFSSSRSGLERVRTFGERVVRSEPYSHLCQLLDYEQNTARVAVQLRVGSDGTIRGFEFTAHHPNTRNPFYRSAFARFMTRCSMWLRGYRFSEHEVLSRLLDQVLDGLKPYILEIFQLLGDMEFYLAGLAFADDAAMRGKETSFTELHESSSLKVETRIESLFNPFLLAQGIAVKTCDVAVEHDAIVVVTGPNSGGKTRLLQSIGLCHVLAHVGFPVPAARAELSWRRGMFASLIDDMSAGQREGRLGMELIRIREIFERINVGDLIVLDELCSGTNPSEGEEIFKLVLQHLAELGPQVWLTTHLLSFAAQLQADPPLPQLRFLAVELDADDKPTFKFVPGVAKTSLAGQTAARLGVTRLELRELVARALARHDASAEGIATLSHNDAAPPDSGTQSQSVGRAGAAKRAVHSSRN
jgi:DNA mismatch repair protein MutS2